MMLSRTSITPGRTRSVRPLACLAALVACSIAAPLAPGAALGAESPSSSPAPRDAAIRYVEAMAVGDRVAVGRLDFACQFRLAASATEGPAAFPPESAPLYDECWRPIQQANMEAVMDKDQGVHALWPGQGKLIFYREDYRRYQYAPSAYVSPQVGDSRTGTPLSIEHVSSEPVPPASFRLRPGADVIGVPATGVTLRIHYANPVTSPVSYEAGTYQFVSPVERPRAALKTVTITWIVLSDLERHGFPADQAVLNLPVVPATPKRPAVPFLVEYSRQSEDARTWWQPAEASTALTGALERAKEIPSLLDRVALYNRVLMIEPDRPDALDALARDLYQALLDMGLAAQQIQLANEELSARVSEFYWDTYAHTERLDISIGMQMGGYDQPSAADYLFRMIPAMERLTELRPHDLENWVRLGAAYRWNLDQLTAIETHAGLLETVPPERPNLRARVMTALAMSKTTKVAFNRTLEDPTIREAYHDAGRAYELATDPVQKFAAAYAMAYSLIFTPDRDNRMILRHLRDAKTWYLKVPGATEASWRRLLANETVKAVIDADPSLQQLVAAGDRG